MKRFILFFTIILFATLPVSAADDPVARAMKLYEKRHYEEAAGMLRAESHSVEQARKGAAHLTLGMIYMKNAELYRELYQESLAVAQSYLKKLSAGPGKGRSRFADFYLGKALREAGKPGVAISYLEKFIADENINQRYRAIAKVELGLCSYLNGDTQKAEEIWNSIDSTDLEVRAELASAYSRAGLTDKNPAALCDQALGEVKKIGKSPSVRMVRNSISVYAREGLTDKGFELLKRADTKAYSYQELLGKSKTINFYDLSLLADLSALYGQASIVSLEKAAADAAVKDPARYYLGQAYTLFGSADQSSTVMNSFVSSSRMPQQYKDRIRVWQAAAKYHKGGRTDALTVWDGLSKKQPLDPDALAEILFACARVKAQCPSIVKKTEEMVATGGGKRFSSPNIALGKYYLANKNTAKAIVFMEAGRDKSNKNKIESNDPLMLVDLAGMYYRNKKFSESLEIYFELSKQFPAVRQIQEALQGIYVMEQKSAGDVKIF